MRLCYMWNLGFILWFLFSETDAQQISCGTTPASTHGNAFARIFGGTRAVYGSIPWQVNLLENGSPRCGATLIHQKWILTAAHCVYLSLLNQNANLEYTAIAGDHDTEKDDLFEQLRFVVRVTVHQAFDGKTLENDIALLEVDKEFAFNNYVVPACLPNRGELPYPFTNCEVSGWGFTSATTKAEILQKLDLPVLPHKACEVIHTPTEGRPTIFTKKMLCAGHLEGGRDACQGDSGGPLVCPTYGSSNGEKFVNGIVSWGNGCAEQGQAGVYTNVASHRAWIDETLALKPVVNDNPCQYSGVEIRNQREGSIHSPGFGNSTQYASNLRCNWIVELSDLTSASDTVLISFQRLDVEESSDQECRYDYVDIYGGDNLDILQGTYCGRRRPADLELSKTRSKPSTLRFKVVFHSDSSIGRRGFRINFRIP